MAGIFDWSVPGLNRAHFHALANLLSLRNHGQAERRSLSSVVLEEDWDSDDSEDGQAPSINTNAACQLSGSGHGKLKQKFLDCLAEFADNKKDGTTVACSVMVEAENSVSIWISRNEGFAEADCSVFERVEKLLGSLSISNGTSHMN
jgi:hypothetical protein